MARVRLSHVLKSIALLASIVALCISGTAWAQEGSSGQPSQDEMMKQMMEFATPDQHHKELGKLVGTWNTVIKIWMGAEPTVTNGTSTYEWILGGRYLQSKHTGVWAGMPYEGMGIDGYDKGKKEYFTLWFDNFGTGMMNLTGQESADGKTMTYTGMAFEPTQGRDVPVREECAWTGDNSYTFTMYMQMAGPDGKPQEQRVMEIAAEKQ